MTGLKGIALDDGGLRCEQEVAGGRDVYQVPLPAVVTVKEGLNLPRYPSVPGRMRAKRKPLETRTPARAGAGLEKVRLVVPEGQGKQAEILGHGPDAAPAVVELLRAGGVPDERPRSGRACGRRRRRRLAPGAHARARLRRGGGAARGGR